MTSQSNFGAAFETHLEHIGEEGKAVTLSVNEMVRLCLPQIRRAKKQKFTWDAIATCIQAAVQQIYGQEVSIAPSTAKRAYYKLTQKKKQPDSTTTDSKPRSRPTSTTSPKSSAPTPAKTPVQVAEPPAPAVTTVPTPVPEPVARSPAAEPELEPTNAPVANETPIPDKETPKPKRQKRSTRPNNSTFTRGYEGLNYL